MKNESQIRILLLQRLLCAQTDEEHTVSVSDILQFWASHGIQASRKSVYSDIQLLIDQGMDIICIKSTQNRYFIGQRLFELPELKLLVDTKIYELLYNLGVTANYTGFFHMAYAVSLCLEQPDRLLLVTKWLYPEVAKQYGTNWKAVEWNIRTASCIIWRKGRPLLEELAHRRLEKKPRNTQMLSILVYSLNTGP